jgi:hypothetical protein
MSYTTKQICNLALSKVGDNASLITSLDDGSTESFLCKEFYEPTLKELLASHTWNFAKCYAQLSASVTEPTFGWDFSYPFPGDCIRPIELRHNGSSTSLRYMNEWNVVGRTIYSNISEAYLIYIKYIIDPNLYPPLFIRAFYTSLASKLAFPLTEDKNLVVSLENELSEVILPEARRVNGFEGYNMPRIDSDWLEANYSSGSLGDMNMTFSRENYGELP